MHQDLQKASLWKRISAYLFDVILLATLAVGIAFVLSSVLGYDDYTAKRAALRHEYEVSNGVSFDMDQEEYEKLHEGDRERIDAAYAEFARDPEVRRIDALIINLSLLITVFSILIPFLLLEFIVPILFGHGRTLGKKIFGVAIMRVDGVKISSIQLFVRALLGKYTLETMLPIFLLFLLLLNAMPLVSVAGLALLLTLQLATILFSAHHSPLHDAISGTVAVDYASQMIFNSPEAALEYAKKKHAEDAQRAEYR